MKVVLNALGIVCVPVGGVWILQGLNILKGSVMSAHRRWILIGAVVLAAGVALLILNNRRKKAQA